MEVILDENEVCEYTQTDIRKLVASDDQALSQLKKDATKSRRIILDSVRDHVVSNLHGKETPFAIWKTPLDLI